MHIYETPDGTKVPSVTTILQILGSKDIIKWANYLGFKHVDYDEELNRLAEGGTLMHSVVQRIIDPSITDPIVFRDSFEEAKYMKLGEKFQNMIKDYSYNTIFTEKSFVSAKLGYGGTIDWLAEMSGLTMLNDFKSSKKVYMKHLLQLGGYYNLLTANGYKVNGGSIILLNNRICTLYPINEEDLWNLGGVFDRLCNVYYHLNKDLIPYDEELLRTIKKSNSQH